MADVNMNVGNQPLPAEVQAYITNLQAQLAVAQAGQNMGQQCKDNGCSAVLEMQ
jgi:hypothetical protein